MVAGAHVEKARAVIPFDPTTAEQRGRAGRPAQGPGAVNDGDRGRDRDGLGKPR